jgi:hypothetical protein
VTDVGRTPNRHDGDPDRVEIDMASMRQRFECQAVTRAFYGNDSERPR